MHHDPNTPEIEPIPSGPDHDEPVPQDSPVEETPDSFSIEHLPPSDEFLQQADIAEPLEATISEEEPEAEIPYETHITDELFQQGDIAEPFEASIPRNILDGSDDDVPQPPVRRPKRTELLPAVEDVPELADDQDRVLFDDDSSSRASASKPLFDAKEFGINTGIPPADPTTSGPSERSLDDLSLSELAGLFWRRPFATWDALLRVLRDSSEDPTSKKNAALNLTGLTSTSSFNEFKPIQSAADSQPSIRRGLSIFQPDVTLWEVLAFGLQILAYILALMGCVIFIRDVFARRQESEQLVGGFPNIVFGTLIWLLAELIQHRRGILNWVKTRRPINWTLMVLRLIPIGLFIWVLLRWMDASDLPYEEAQQALDAIAPTFPLFGIAVVAWIVVDVFNRFARSIYPEGLRPPTFTEVERSGVVSSSDEEIIPEPDEKKKNVPLIRFPVPEDLDFFRIASGACGTILALITYLGTAGNRMYDPIFYTWVASAVLWAVALSPSSWHPREWASQWASRVRQNLRQPPSIWVVLAVIAIAFLAVVMRTDRLYGDPMQGTRIPPEMTSDHVEKILDAQRVLEGPASALCYNLPTCNRDIFFANNGGREPFQMYALAFAANLVGHDVDYNLLKTLALIESLLSLPIIGWFAWEILSTEKRSLRLTFAVLVMALVAVSYWHLNITRLALRIVLTPAVASLLMIYLSRAMRRNQRADFIKAGICLGVGLYMYQAVRMLPVVIVAGVALAAYFGTTHWRERGRYALNLVALVLVSFVIFIPMFHYSVENPDMFLRRTAGRLFGDDIISTTLSDGTVIERHATTEEQIAAFQKNIPVLLSNMRNALLMFNWKGDVAWINNTPNSPALDPFVGALLILGVVAWGSLAVRRGDVVYVFIPIMILIMLLPSALSIAYPIENPSFTRTSGALPAVFLLAAYPMALISEQVRLLLSGVIVRRVTWVLMSGVILASFVYSMQLYTTKYVQSYLISSLPYSQAGQILRGFATSDGSYGNAFMIAYTYWWDHRAIGLEAGLTDWPNGIVTRDDVPSFLRDAANRSSETYRFDPQKDILFFYAPVDIETSTALKQWFPQGQEREVTAYQTGDNFMLYRVPALGAEAFQSFVAQTVP